MNKECANLFRLEYYSFDKSGKQVGYDSETCLISCGLRELSILKGRVLKDSTSSNKNLSGVVFVYFGDMIFKLKTRKQLTSAFEVLFHQHLENFVEAAGINLAKIMYFDGYDENRLLNEANHILNELG